MTYTLNIKAFTDSISDRNLLQLSSDNSDLRFETDASGKLIVMPPTGSQTGNRNANLTYQVWYWNSQSKLGVAFGSSTGFKLSNGATRSPDVSWIAIDRWNSLNDRQKMNEYMNCGVKLGWLINPDAREVGIYRPNKNKETLSNPSSLSGKDILPGLTMDLSDIFQTD